ncbi:hypothetical protein QEN19_002155 [Hanseniaspora menglaensis]
MLETELTKQIEHTHPDIKQNDLPEISLTALILGLILGIFITLVKKFKFIGLPLNIIFLCLFHFLEFYITAKYNPTQVTTNSYIIRNGNEYTVATLFSIFECIITTYYFNKNRNLTLKLQIIMVLGMLMAITGQVFRSLAMITCGKSFNHIVQSTKKGDHQLITSGIYQLSRHPSYFGYFYWSIGCQLMCLNFVSAIVFTVVLWNFFNKRIQLEEKYLFNFFGKDYKTFKHQVWVGIPFIN